MNILITGAKGFVGRNLCENLKALRDGKNRTRPALRIEKLFEYDLDSPRSILEFGCREADFVFHLAGVNRPKDPADFEKGNLGFSRELLELLQGAWKAPTPVRLLSVPAYGNRGR